MRASPRLALRTNSSSTVLADSGTREKGASNLDAVFSALSDPTRRAMLDRLSKGEASVTELAKPFKISLPAVSKHLRILEDSGLVRREKSGRIHKIQLAPTSLMQTLDWLEHYRPRWQTQLDSLSAYLEREKRGKPK